MFGRRKDEQQPPSQEGGKEEPAMQSSQGRPAPAGRPVARPQVVHRPPDVHGATARRQREEELEGKSLIVGRDIALSGEIKDCDRLIVEGRVEANLAKCEEIEITPTGAFKGEAEIDTAEISGIFEGALTARRVLIVRATGRVSGTIRYGEVEIERGGQINGDVAQIDAAAKTAQPEPPQPEPPSQPQPPEHRAAAGSA